MAGMTCLEPRLERGGVVPLCKWGFFFAKFLNKGCQKGVYNCIFQAVPNDTFKNAQTAKKGEYYAS